MDRRIGAAVVALAAWLTGTVQARAQAADSAPRFSLFGGALFRDASGIPIGKVSNLEGGGSMDFRLGRFPLPLRSTLAFSQDFDEWQVTPRRFGALSLDAIAHPVPRFFGVQPYLLGGFGIATSSNYRAIGITLDANGNTHAFVDPVPRQTWAFAEGGIGLELGRHVFLQCKFMTPLAMPGPTRAPISVGFRF